MYRVESPAMGAPSSWWWSEKADGWWTTILLEHVVSVRQVEGTPAPTFEIRLAGKEPFRREVSPAPGESAWQALEVELPFFMGFPGASPRGRS